MKRIEEACEDRANKLDLSSQERQEFRGKCVNHFLNKLEESSASCEVVGVSPIPKERMWADFEELCKEQSADNLLDEISHFDETKARKLLNEARKPADKIENIPSPEAWLRKDPSRSVEMTNLIEEIEEESYNAPDEETRQDFLKFAYKKWVVPLLIKEQIRKFCYAGTPFADEGFKSDSEKLINGMDSVPISEGGTQGKEGAFRVANKQEKKQTVWEISVSLPEPFKSNRQKISKILNEFNVDLNHLSYTEAYFLLVVLIRGELEGYWKVSRWVAGGDYTDRGALGIDFKIMHLEGGNTLIELKHGSGFAFTDAQLRRFRRSIDDASEATRFIGIWISSLNPKKNLIVCYWTPKFFKTLPKKNFNPSSERRQSAFIFRGLEECLKINSFTTLLEELKGELFKELLNTPNLTMYNLEGGAFGHKGAQYTHIPIEMAYEIIFLKLKQTITHREEDEDWEYDCKAGLTREKIIGEARLRIRKYVLNLLKNKYRLIFSTEIIPYVKKDKFIGKYLRRVELEASESRDKRERVQLFGLTLTDLITYSFKKMTSEGELVAVETEGKPSVGYGLPGRKYLPIGLTASEFLDIVKTAIEHEPPLPECFYMSDLWERTRARGTQGILSKLFVKTKDQLKKERLITFRKNRDWKACITKRGYDYLFRGGHTGEFAP